MTPFYIFDAADKEAPTRGRVQFLAASSERSAIRLWATFTSLDPKTDLRIVDWAKCACDGSCACCGWIPTGEQIAASFAPVQQGKEFADVVRVAEERRARHG